MTMATERTAQKILATTRSFVQEFAWIVSGLTIASVAYCAVAYLGFHLHYPYNSPFFYHHQEFTDFTIYHAKFAFFHQSAFFKVGYPFTYPALMALLYEVIFSLSAAHPLRVFLLIACLAFLIPGALWSRALVRAGLKWKSAALFVAIVLVTSWPAGLLVDRANVEIFVWISLLVGVWAYVTGREWLAASLFAVAASLKLFPFVFLTLFLTRRGWPKLVAGACVFGAVTVLSLAILGPTIPIAYHGISTGLAMFHDDYMVVYSMDLTGLDHSLMGLIKTAIVVVQRKNYGAHLREVANFYIPCMALIGLILYAVRIRKLPLLNQLMAFSIISILFTPFSGDGTLIHLYYSFALCCFLAISAYRQQVSIPGLRVIMLCYAYLLSYQSFWVMDHRRVEAQFKCLALILLLYCALKYPLSASLRSGALPIDLSRPDASRVLATNAGQRA